MIKVTDNEGNVYDYEYAVSMYDFELIWDNGNRSRLVTYQNFVDTGSSAWYWNWAGNEMANIIAKITDEGHIDRRIEVHVNAHDQWRADAYRALAEMFSVVGVFNGSELYLDSIVVILD